MSSSNSIPSWLKNAVPNPAFDIVPQCSVSCSGFSSLRPECEVDPCLANNLCHLLPPTTTSSSSDSSSSIKDNYASCAEWCCVSHSSASVFMILSLFAALFFVLLGCYYARLFKKDERFMKEKAMEDAVDAATSGPSKVLQGARQRLQDFSSSVKKSFDSNEGEEMKPSAAAE